MGLESYTEPQLYRLTTLQGVGNNTGFVWVTPGPGIPPMGSYHKEITLIRENNLYVCIYTSQYNL